MKPKHIIRALKKYAELHCKENRYYALERTYKPFYDEESKEWKVGVIVERSVNHGRRVKKVFKKHGINAAMAYLTVFKKDEHTEVPR